MSVTKVCGNIKELDKDTQLALSYLTEALDAEKIEYRIFETFRSQERQNYLYAQGRTRPGQVITWTTQSQHITRRAIDIIHPKNLWNMPNSYWKRIAELATKVGFTCGYYWPKQDKPHIQLNKGVKPKRIIKKQEEYMFIKQDVRFDGIGATVEAIEKEGRTYIKTSDLVKLGLDVQYREETKEIELSSKIKEVEVLYNKENIKLKSREIKGRNYFMATELEKLGLEAGYKDGKPTLDNRKG